MVIPTHNDIVKVKMTQLANVTNQAEARITEQILSNSANSMRDNLGVDDYEAFLDSLAPLLIPVGTGDDEYLPYNVFDGKTFDALTDEEKSLRNLIFAEAYFGLYYLSIALRKLVKGSVGNMREQAGGTSITATPFDDIIANAEIYREQAINFISSALGNDEDSDVYSDGSLGVFVV